MRGLREKVEGPQSIEGILITQAFHVSSKCCGVTTNVENPSRCVGEDLRGNVLVESAAGWVENKHLGREKRGEQVFDQPLMHFKATELFLVLSHLRSHRSSRLLYSTRIRLNSCNR
jgi:hypothetical protein